MILQHFGRLAGVLALFVSLVGCSKDDHKNDAHGTAAGSTHADGGHPEEGPHHGHLIELGNEEFHAELVHDDATNKVTIYLLDAAAQKAVAVAEMELSVNLVVAGKPQPYKLPAVAQPGDAAGQSSRFELTSAELCQALDDEKTTGRLSVVIAGKPYSGDMSHAGHDDHK